MDKKLFLISIVMSIFLLLPAHAAIVANASIVDNSIYPDEMAKFKLTISNTDNYAKTLTISSTDVQFYTETEPSFTQIDPGQTIQVELRLIPSVWAQPGAQGVDVFIFSSTSNEKVSMQLPVYIKEFGAVQKEYNPSVEMKVTFPSEIDPRQEVPMNLYFRNRNRLDIKEMEISVEGKLFNDFRVVPLEQLSERREDFSYKIDRLTPPGNDTLTVSIRVNNRTINRERVAYEIIAYSAFAKKEDSVEALFKKTTEYLVTNDGNIEKKDTFKVPTSIIRRLFTTSSPAPSGIDLAKQANLEWNLDLMPMQETKIVVTENYRPLIYLLLIGIVISMVYFLYRSPVTIKKDSIIVGSSHDGISEMKVLLHIRNRSQDLVEHIKVTDLVPSIAELVRETHIGTLTPEKIIRTEKKGTIVKWELDALEPFEERIITYRLNSKITIVGGLTLPPAKIKFETKKGKERTVRSNASQVSMGL